MWPTLMEPDVTPTSVAPPTADPPPERACRESGPPRCHHRHWPPAAAGVFVFAAEPEPAGRGRARPGAVAGAGGRPGGRRRTRPAGGRGGTSAARAGVGGPRRVPASAGAAAPASPDE